MIMVSLISKKLDVGMAGNGAIAGLVAITAPSGYVEFWAAPIIGVVGGLIVVVGLLAIDKYLDDPSARCRRTAWPASGARWRAACSPPTASRRPSASATPGLFYGGGLTQLAAQAAAVGVTFAVVFGLSYLTFLAIKVTVGLRVEDDVEDAGLDIVEHGMYGYPEQFIPAPELVGYGAAPTAPPHLTGSLAMTKEEVTA
jgi:Amt family ammonium transporter